MHISIAIAMVVSFVAVLLNVWKRPSRVCGYAIPGTSPVFAQQSASAYLDSSSPSPVALWPTEAWPTPLRMLLLPDALHELDANQTNVPVLRRLDGNMLDRSLELRREMIPHIIRGSISRSICDSEGALVALSSLHGQSKLGDNARRGLVDRYFGGNEEHRTLGEYLESPRPSDYWVSCILSELNRGEASGGLDVRATKWLDAVTDALRPLALLGLAQSRVDDVCLRVTRTESRIPAHFDTWHNTLVQVGDGVRRVLLFMPDNADRLYATRIGASGDYDHATISRVDFRNLDADDFPLAKMAWALPATLQPGDSLHIPAGWWHYVESASTTAVGRGDDTEMPSVALNLITMHHQGVPADAAPADRRTRESAWVEVPCPAA